MHNREIDNHKTETLNYNTKPDKPNINRSSKNKTLNIFRANITSLSKHALAYLFREYSKFHVWSLLQTRVTATILAEQRDYFKKRTRKIIATQAISSNGGGIAYGGELMSSMHHLSIAPIDDSVLLCIKYQTGSPPRFVQSTFDWESDISLCKCLLLGHVKTNTSR